MGLFSFLTKEIAIDLGTANTIIIYNDKIVVDEPSIVAMERSSGKIIAVGKKAMMMHGKTHENIKTIRPLRDGVIADFQATEAMIREMIKMVGIRRSLFSPRTENGYLYPFRYHGGGRKSRKRFSRTGRSQRSKAYP